MARLKKQQELTIPESIYSITPILETKKGRKVFKDNPFITSNNFVIQIRKDIALVANGISITDKNEDIIEAGVIGKIQYVDTEQFIKLYTRNIAILFDIAPSAQKALITVFCAVQMEAKDKAHIFLTYSKAREYYEELGFQKIPSRSTFFSGIKILIEMGFLAAHYWGEGWYWFNPNLIFNGDRVRFITEYRLKRQTENKREITENLNLISECQSNSQ